ncbi:MAG: hypothetical protein LBR72_07360 [Oscillospiraceae bacterium]|jgi:hypothetical protein|nr:hypothetical protein [Oscillospiraceae bacterium]
MKRALLLLLALILLIPAGLAAEGDPPIDPETETSEAAESYSVVLTENVIVITPENPRTIFEYAIVTAEEQNNPNWVVAGSAGERGSSELIERFPPRGVAYEVWVRAQDSEVIEKRTGFIALTPKLFLDMETVGPFSGGADGTVWYVTYDGEKWETVTANPSSDLFIDIAKKLGKKELNFAVKKAVLQTDSEGVETLSEPEKSTTVVSAKIKPRPVLTKDYAVKAFVSEEYPANWTLTGGKAALEYSSNNGLSWSPFTYEVGLPLLSVGDQAMKIKATAYQFRIAANEAGLIPASAPKKYTQVKQVKAPLVKPDYKKETAKLKEGMLYAFGEAGAKFGDLTFKPAVGEPIDIEEAITEEQTIYIYIADNGKKSRSALQTITLAKRGIAPDEGEGLVARKASASLEKGFEYYGSKEKWGSFTKGDTEGLVRRKATAKYNAKTGVNVGNAASRSIECAVTYPADKKGLATVAIEPKETFPFLRWELQGSVSGGTADPFKEGAKDVAVQADTVGGTVGFSVKPVFDTAETAPKVGSLKLVFKDEEVLPSEDGAYLIEGAYAGDVVTLTITPEDRDTYRESLATVTVRKPAEKDPPFAISFGTPNNAQGNFGLATVTFKPIALAQSRSLRVDLIIGDKVVNTVTVPAEYSSAFIGAQTQTQEVDMRAVMRAAGPGDFTLRACFEGGDSSSESASVTAQRSFGQNHFAIWEIVTEIGRAGVTDAENPTVPAYPIPGDTLKVTAVRDGFGNDLLPQAAFQWWQSYSAQAGVPVPQTEGGNDGTLTVPEDAFGSVYSVEIGIRGVETTSTARFAPVGTDPSIVF